MKLFFRRLTIIQVVIEITPIIIIPIVIQIANRGNCEFFSEFSVGIGDIM